MPRAKSAKLPKTRADQRLATREDIRVAAWELFSTQGFDETTTNAIARRAGVAAGTVFVHASDKADLLFLVMHDRLVSVVESAFESIPSKDSPLVDRMLHVFRRVFAMYGEHPGVAAAFVKNLPGARGPNAERSKTMTFGFLHRLSLLVVDAQATGEVARDVDPIKVAGNVFALYFFALLSWLDGHTALESAVDTVLRDALELLHRGLRSPLDHR